LNVIDENLPQRNNLSTLFECHDMIDCSVQSNHVNLPPNGKL